MGLTDLTRGADKWIHKHLGGSKIEALWNILPSGILVSYAS
jgi:hypothetical protein